MTKARDLANAGTALTTVDATELGYLNGVTSAVQTQLDAKIAKTLTTTTGDIIYASGANTPARLGIGSTSQVLSVSGGVPAWATPSSGSYTLLLKASFSNVADTGTTFDGLFTSAYDNYVIVINNLYGANSADDPQIQFRYAGPTTQATTHHWRYAQTEGTAWTSFGGAANSNFLTLAERIGGSNGYGSSFTINAMNILSAGSRPYVTWSGFIEDEKFVVGGGYQWTSRTYTGFLMKSSSGNISGTATVYGLRNA